MNSEAELRQSIGSDSLANYAQETGDLDERHYRQKTLSTLQEDAYGEESQTETSKCSQPTFNLDEQEGFRQDLLEVRKETELRDEMLLSNL